MDGKPKVGRVLCDHESGWKMIIEVTGPTGSGKSTVAAKLKHALLMNGDPVVHVGECETKHGELPEYFTNASKHGIRTDLHLFPWSLAFILFHPIFAGFAAGCLLMAEGGIRTRIAILRSIWRKAGLFTYFGTRRFRNVVVIIDEGVFHSAHNILVFPSKSINLRAIKVFGKLVPLPELLVINRADSTELVRRLKGRGDLSTRVTLENLNSFCNHAAQVFDSLSGMQRIGERALEMRPERSDEIEIADILGRLQQAA